MPRAKARVDANQKAVVAALRSIPGVRVIDTSAVGQGFPDLTVGFRARCTGCRSRHRLTVLLEVKDGGKPPSHRRLTDAQLTFHGDFTGAIFTVTSAAHAVAVVTALLDGGEPPLTDPDERPKTKPKP